MTYFIYLLLNGGTSDIPVTQWTYVPYQVTYQTTQNIGGSCHLGGNQFAYANGIVHAVADSCTDVVFTNGFE